MKALLLAAGLGTRFRPVTEEIPKSLFPFLNVPLALGHLSRLANAGVSEVGINLHHLGSAIEQRLSDLPAGLPRVRFFHEPQILGTAGALRNASEWLAGDDFVVVNADSAINADFGALLSRHRETGRAVTLLVTENEAPARFTPLASEGDRIVSFGTKSSWPLAYTGVSAFSPRVLPRIPEGERSLVTDLWKPLLDSGEEIGWLLHDQPFWDLGTPRDFLRATRQVLTRAESFPPERGKFDLASRILSLSPSRGFDGVSSVIGRATVGRGAHLIESVVWEGVEVGAGAELKGCIAARGKIPPGAVYRDSVLWAAPDSTVTAYPIA
ncbi:MAG TPA: NDP-sugar synthase [Thermoanaerobaculia bacterium]|nr:NDP-sugar synthase [Thermoanaerobaculia bacterium]